jgi:adenosylcobinamide kinase/adenosylcobinamide-phosphate guanylyltransferase
MAKTTLITGGARSGKSSLALAMAEPYQRRAYIATAEALDAEMAERIERHKKERTALWSTFEIPIEVPEWLNANAGSFDVVLIDCLTLWVSNLMLKRLDVDKCAHELLDAMRKSSAAMILVTNEVGMGIVPDNALARELRDRAGWLNRLVADAADEVFLVVAGQNLRIKQNGG